MTSESKSVRRTWVAALLIAAVISLGFVLFLALGEATAGRAPDDSVAARGVVVFVGVNVLPMDSDRILRNQTVVVREGRITAVGPADEVAIPAEAQRIDGKGKYLLPGLTEMHGHVPVRDGSYTFADVSLLYVANGVTTVRGMLGHPSHLELRKQIASGELLGPAYYLSGPAVSGNPRPWGELKTGEDGARVAREIKEAGYEAVKIHEGLAPAAYDGLMAAAKRLGLLTGGHVPNDVGLLHAIESGQGTIEHLDGYVQEMVTEDAPPPGPGLFQLGLLDYVDRTRMADLVARVQQAGVGNVPTLSLYKNILSLVDPDEQAQWPPMRYVPPQVLAQWVRVKKNRIANGSGAETVEKQLSVNRQLIKALHDAGATVYLGSDSPQIFQVPGFSLHEELRLMAEAGLTPHETLAAGTRASGEFLSKFDKFGLVKEGYRADLVLVEANPLEDLTNLERRVGVMADGRWFPAAEMQKRLNALAASYRSRQ